MEYLNWLKRDAGAITLLKKNSLRWRLQLSVLDGFRTDDVRLFQAAGPAKAKQRSPNFSHVLGCSWASWRRLLADRSRVQRLRWQWHCRQDTTAPDCCGLDKLQSLLTVLKKSAAVMPILSGLQMMRNTVWLTLIAAVELLQTFTNFIFFSIFFLNFWTLFSMLWTSQLWFEPYISIS